MIRLGNTTQKLQALLGGAVATTEADIVTSYRDEINTTQSQIRSGGASKLTTSSGASAVDIVAAPSQEQTIRVVEFISVRNNDTAAITLTIRYNDNGTTYKIISIDMAVGDELIYTAACGFRLMGANGVVYTVQGPELTGPIYINDTANANNTAGLTVNQGAVSTGHSLTCKSSDIATGLSTIVNGVDVEGDDFATIEAGGTGGGMLLKGLGESASAFGFVVYSYSGAPATTDTTASAGSMNFIGGQHDGANALVDMAAGSNLAVWREQDSAGSLLTRMLLKADDGELHLGNTTLVALDDHDDLDLIEKAEDFRTNWQDKPFQAMKAQSGYDKLVEIGLLGNITQEEWDAGHRPLMSAQRAIQLVKGEARQRHAKFESLMEALEERTPGLRMAYNAKLQARGLAHLGR